MPLLTAVLDLALYMLCLGLLGLLWCIGRRDLCLFGVFLSFLVSYLGLMVSDFLLQAGVWTVVEHSLYRRIPGRIVPAIGVWWFLGCLLARHDRSAPPKARPWD